MVVINTEFIAIATDYALEIRNEKKLQEI